jgi:hypothetical protein
MYVYIALWHIYYLKDRSSLVKGEGRGGENKGRFPKEIPAEEPYVEYAHKLFPWRL